MIAAANLLFTFIELIKNGTVPLYNHHAYHATTFTPEEPVQ